MNNDRNDIRSQDRIIPQVDDPSENEIDWLDLWDLLLRWKITVISVAFVVFLAVIAIGFFNEPVPAYKVWATLSLPSDSDIKGLEGSQGS